MYLFASLLLTLVGSVRADTVLASPQAPVAVLPSAAQGQLQAADAGTNVFDGAPKRREGPLEIVSEEKGVVIERNHLEAGRFCETEADMIGDRPSHAIRHCETLPARTVTVTGDRQKVHIADRGAYNRKDMLTGGLIGGGIGLLGFLAILAGPIGLGIGIGIATTLIGAGLGVGIAYLVDSNKPDNFERVVNEKTTTTTP